MPSSSEAVATSAFSSPARSRRSTRRRRSFERLPWWAATTSSPSRSPSSWASRSANRRVLTNTMVVRWPVTCSAIRSSTLSIWAPDAIASSSPSGSSMATSSARRWPGVDDRAVGPAVGAGAGADQQRGDHLDGLLRRRQPHPGRWHGADVGEPFEREAEVAPALVPGQGVDLVDDDGLDAAERRPALLGRDQQVERLRGGDDERARRPDHGRPLAGGAVAGAHPDREVGRGQPEPPRRGGDLGQRSLEVLGDVDRQRLQRRDVDDPGAADREPPGVGEVQPVDGHEEAGQRLARAGGRRHQRVLPGGDGWPGGLLRGCGPVGEALPEPGRDGGMQLDRGQERGVDRRAP